MCASKTLPPTTDAARPVGPGRPKDLGKRAAILDAAKHLFTRHSFDAVSMDQIAAEAGVSKLTVYSHFGDKESLFGEAVRARCEDQLPVALFQADLPGGPRERLTAIAEAFFALVTSDEAIAVHRTMMTDATDPHVRELFWASGPQRIKDAFAEFLHSEVDKGDLRIGDIPRAASQFFALIKGEAHMRLLCGLCCSTGPGDPEGHIRATVELFLRAYGADAPETPENG